MRIAFFCMPSLMSVAALDTVLAAGHEVAAVVQPQGGLKGRTQPFLVRDKGFQRRLKRKLLKPFARDASHEAEQDPSVRAAREGIPQYRVGDASAPPMIDLLKRERIEGIAIVFFNQLLRRTMLERLPAGAINAHPSLLPHLRGPSPLFWSYHRGESNTGVTVHRVTAGEDSGPIFGQRSVHVPLGLPGEELVEGLARNGAPLVERGLNMLAAGEQGEPQRGRGVRAHRPTSVDRRLNCRLPAHRVYHLVRGVGRWVSLVIEIDGRCYRAIDARGYDDAKRPPGDWALLGEETLMLACERGSVELSVRALNG